SVMSSASTVTYTSVYTDSKPGRVFWGADDELSGGVPEHPPSLDYVPGPEHPSSPAEPLPADASPVALSPGYVADSDLEKDPEEDPEEDHADYPADGRDDDDEPFDDDDDDTNDEDEEPFEDEDDDEEEEHLAPADFVIATHVGLCSSQRRLSRSKEGVERLLALPPPPPSPLISLSLPSAEERLARCLAAPALPSSPLPIVPHPYGGPNHIPSTPLPPLPSSLHLPPPVPTSLPLPLSPLPPLPASLFIPPPVDRREDIPKAELPPCKRVDYGFIGTLEAETKCQRAEEVGYGIRNVWVDPTEAVEEVAPKTLEGVNARVIELVAVQEQDTQDIYVVIEDDQDRWTQLSQRVDILIEDRHSAVHYELQAYMTHTWIQDHRIDSQESLTATLIAHVSSLQGQLSAALDQIQALQARDPTHADDPEGADSYA
ncbi:hypothetical protein Tco_0573040, partial [Tanacetum coccineum]